MGLFSFHFRYLQVTMRICERSATCLHDQLDLCWGELASKDTNEELEEPQEIQCCETEGATEP